MEHKEKTSNISVIDKIYYEHLDSKYTALWRQFEYQDSNIFKLVNIYFVIAGLFLANIDTFSKTPEFSALLVFITGAVFCLLLYRTSELLKEVKMTLRKVDDEIAMLHGSTKDNYYSIPYSFDRGARTSLVGWISIGVFSVIMTAYLLSIILWP